MDSDRCRRCASNFAFTVAVITLGARSTPPARGPFSFCEINSDKARLRSIRLQRERPDECEMRVTEVRRSRRGPAFSAAKTVSAMSGGQVHYRRRRSLSREPMSGGLHALRDLSAFHERL